MKKVPRFLLPIVLICILSGFYLPTMAPGLTWANYGSDGGDLISAAYTKGIPHPTGYPVYLILADLFQQLPIGSLAYRTNLLSAIAALLTSLCIYAIVEITTRSMHPIGSRVSGLVAALAFGLSPIVWSQAIITEVYTLHALFVALTLYFLLDAHQIERSLHQKTILGLVLGLAIGNHLTALLLFPGVALASWKADKTKTIHSNSWTWANVWGTLYTQAVGLLCGVIVYGFLPIRASQHPAVNWGNPTTLDGLIWLVSGEMYHGNVMGLSSQLVLGKLQTWVQILLDQFGLLGLILCIVGLVWSFHNSPFQRMLLFNAISFSIFWMYYQVVDSHVFLIPTVISISIWIGFGCSEVLRRISTTRSNWRVWVVGLLLLVYWLVLFAPTHLPHVDASQDMRAEQFGEYVLKNLPKHAIVFANGDRATFALWYFQYGLSQRTDVSILSVGLLPYDWYRNGLRYTYPWLEIPDPSLAPWITSIKAGNSDLPVCHVYFVGEPLVYCE